MLKSNRSSLTRACNVKHGDLNRELQRQIADSFIYVSDCRQSDEQGGGLIASRPIMTPGTKFVDVCSKYVVGKTPALLLTKRGYVIKSGEDYFDLNKGMTQFINEARDGKKPNVRFKKDYNLNKIALLVIRDIEAEEEVLVVYNQSASL
eukprot:scaffold83277_cov59-Attheya_sp.AAC.1